MARKRRSKSHRPNQQGSHSTTNRKREVTHNIYADLASVPEEGEELNAHLAEKFAIPLEDPTSETQTVTNKHEFQEIEDYYRRDQSTQSGWLGKSEIPSTLEVFAGDSGHEHILDLAEEPHPNKVNGPYNSKEEYLGTQYELLREDAIRPLRDAIREVRSSPWLNESEYAQGAGIGIYEPVYITSAVFSPRGLATRVAFSLNRVKKHIRWEQSKRLITGTLVALSPADDAFQTECVLATVAARPLSTLEQNPPQIDIFFARPEETQIDPMRKWIMVEARSSFYEGSRHTLMALQHMAYEPFPLSEHIVEAEQHVEPPPYVQRCPVTDMSSLVTMEESAEFHNVDILQEWQWPSGGCHGLDKSQSKALKRILTKGLAIVQGPPGTGKTYVSVVALKIMLSNLRADDPPVIVTCQTNHALDQLLRHIAEFEPKFIRLGGRSKDKDKIKKRTLYEVRMSTSQERIPGGLKSRAMTRIRKMTKTMQMLLAPLEANKPPMDHRVLLDLGLITKDQAESLEMDAQQMMATGPGIEMEQWLGKCLMPCHHPVEPDDFGIEFEEEDFEVEQLKELEAEAIAVDDDDIEALKGPVTLLCDNHIGRGGLRGTDEDIKKLLSQTPDLTTIPVPERGAIYNYFVREAKRLILVEYRKAAREYYAAVRERQIGQWQQDARLLREQRLIGMTTTGLSKYRALISSLHPRVVLVEEAAETLEAPVTAALLPSLEQLILVGDHQQLRPHCQVRAFEDEPFNFNLSLFERMVVNGIDYDTLSRQRRMIPEIRRLLHPIYEDQLKDHPNVKDKSNRPPVLGMGGNNSFFFTHEWPETKDANMSSLNEKEADMIVGLFDYLVLNGEDPTKITILTFYNGQRKAIGKRLRQHPNLRGVSSQNVVTVDSYQGEENDIVLLSLVRSNQRRNIGFLSVDNRVCVALSRAKRGFYIFGNAEMLACESGTWASVVDIMYGKGKGKVDSGQKRRVGYQFPLVCTKHENKTFIEDSSDWQLINGGCSKLCRCSMPCGHTCMLRCHPFDNSRINCTQKCEKYVEACGHRCTAVCCDACRCDICDRRSNGVKSMLKATPTRRANSSWRHLPKPQNIQTSTGFQSQWETRAWPSINNETGSTSESWHDYANGGAREDDARFFELVEEQNTSYTRLIEASPENRPVSKDEHRLIELDSDYQPEDQNHDQEQSNKVGAEERRASQMNFNLLD